MLNINIGTILSANPSARSDFPQGFPRNVNFTFDSREYNPGSSNDDGHIQRILHSNFVLCPFILICVAKPRFATRSLFGVGWNKLNYVEEDLIQEFWEKVFRTLQATQCKKTVKKGNSTNFSAIVLVGGLKWKMYIRMHCQGSVLSLSSTTLNIVVFAPTYVIQCSTYCSLFTSRAWHSFCDFILNKLRCQTRTKYRLGGWGGAIE